MGFNRERFEGDIDEELLCPICTDVLKEPLQAPSCEHVFCSSCINLWISKDSTCPLDRKAITNLEPIPRILRILLSRLSISCDNSKFGCSAILKLDNLNSHLSKCEHGKN